MAMLAMARAVDRFAKDQIGERTEKHEKNVGENVENVGKSNEIMGNDGKIIRKSKNSWEKIGKSHENLQ